MNTAVILGGTHGLGHELALQLRAHGEDTFVVGRSYDETEHGPGMGVDLAAEEDVTKLVTYIQNLGKSTLKRFFWVSGYGYNGDFADQTEPQRMIDVNFAHVVPVAQAVWRKMLTETEPTNFVVVSSTTGVKTRPDEAVYAATKFAQVGMTGSLGKEAFRLGAGVRVALFMPGGMQTPFWEGNEPDSFDDFLDPQKVAAEIYIRVSAQEENYYEQTIERGSL